LPLTPEQFIEDWCRDAAEREAMRRDFVRAGLLEPIPRAPAVVPDWWADYEVPSAQVFSFKKVSNW
jgi:hypothetical protein